MQNAKDTFYILLRDRLAVANPARTVVMRGSVRPAVVVIENELDVDGSEPKDAFLLRWTEHATDWSEPLPLESARCVVEYSTRGTAALAGMDRGRMMDTMNGELATMLQPGAAPKQSFEEDPASTLATSIFWSTPEWSATESKNGTLTRTATVTVFALREAGE